MITKITPETTVKELTELIKHIEIKEGKFVWIELYSDYEGTFYYVDNGENCTLIDFEDLENYLDSGEFNLESIIGNVLQTPDGLKKLMKIIQERI